GLLTGGWTPDARSALRRSTPLTTRSAPRAAGVGLGRAARRLRGLPGRFGVLVSSGHPHGLCADVRVGEFPPAPGRAPDGSGVQGDRGSHAVEGGEPSGRGQRANGPYFAGW